MKTLLTAAILAMASTNASAGIEVCESIADLSETVMEKRQQGADMVQMIQLAGDNKGVIVIVRDAYEMPVFNTPRIVLQVIREFRNKWYGVCLEAVT